MAPYSAAQRKRDEKESIRHQIILDALTAVGKKIVSRFTNIFTTDLFNSDPGFEITFDTPHNNDLVIYRTQYQASGDTLCEISEVIAAISYTSKDKIECHMPIRFGYPDISKIIITSLASKATDLGIKKITITR